jgi:serine/threonine-protein kinase RsbW
MTAPLELQVLPTPDKIADAVDAVCAFLEPQGVSSRCIHHTAMLIEELLTNVGTHGKAPDVPAEVMVAVERDRVIAEVRDRGAPFDPRLAADPDVTLPIEERGIGGLGLFLVRKFSSSLDYRTENGLNRTSFALMRDETRVDG